MIDRVLVPGNSRILIAAVLIFRMPFFCALDAQGALEEEQGKSSSIGFPGQVVGSMRFEVETDSDEEGKGIDITTCV